MLASLVCLCSLMALLDMLLPEKGLAEQVRLIGSVGAIWLLLRHLTALIA